MAAEPPPSSALNEHQQRRLIATCQYVDRLLADLEHSFVEAQSNSPFGRYTSDLAPAELRLVADYIARLRTQLLRMLDGQGLSPAPRRISLRFSLQTHLAFVDDAVEELKPQYMTGYGDVSDAGTTALNGIVEELHNTLRQLSSFLTVGHEKAATRLHRLSADGEAAVLRNLGGLISKYGLVELDGALSAILDTLERRTLELAVFGRVSSGKSSLLNRLLGNGVLPVGVTPITAVPTRITYGPEPKLRVAFADAKPRALDVSALSEYASERLNPANTKRVTRLIVELPSPFLETGITLVDTPGLGSLSSSGTAETLAYLPACDVAAVLVDAASTLTTADLTLIATLRSAGVHVSVLLSKVDLLSEVDREAAVRYTHDLLSREFGDDIHVTPVSVLPELQTVFEAWRRAELAPILEHQEQQRREAAARKIELLRGKVERALIQLRDQHTSRTPEARQQDVQLHAATAHIASTERGIEDAIAALSRQRPRVFEHAASLIDTHINPHAALTRAYESVTMEATARITAALQELADTLRASAPDGIEFDNVALRNAPVPSLPEGLTVPSEGVERMLGHGLAKTIVAGRLERAVGSTVQNALDSYAAVLRRWTLDVLRRIREDWTAATDPVRAGIDRQLGHAGTPHVHREEIDRDLEQLTVMVKR